MAGIKGGFMSGIKLVFFGARGGSSVSTMATTTRVFWIGGILRGGGGRLVGDCRGVWRAGWEREWGWKGVS